MVSEYVEAGIGQKTQAGVLGVSLASAFLCGVNLTVFGPLETWIVDELSISHSLAGLIQSSYFIGNVVGSLVAGSLLYHVPRKTFGLASVLLIALGSALCGIRYYELIVAGRFISGVGNSCSVIFFCSIIVHGFESSQASLLNLYHAILAGGAMLTLLGARTMGAAGGTWTIPLWGTALMAVVLAVVLAPQSLPAMGEGERVDLRAIGTILRHPILIATLFLFIGYNVAEEGLVTFFAAFAEQERHFAVRTAAQMGALYWLGVGFGRLASAVASRKLGERIQIIVCAVAASLFLLCSLVAPGRFGVSLAVFAAGIAAGPVIPLAVSYVVREVRVLKATVLSICNVVCCAGGAVGPAMAGHLGDQWSLLAGLSVVYLLLLISVLPLARLGLRRAGH